MADDVSNFEGPYDLPAAPAAPADSPFQGPYNLTTNNLGGTTLSTSESWLGSHIRSFLPVSPETRSLIAQESPAWGDIGGDINERVNYLYGRMQRGYARQWDPKSATATEAMPYPDPITGAIGSVYEGFGYNPLMYMAGPVVRGATMTGDVINEFGQGFPDWERNLLAGGSMFLNPRSMIKSALSHAGAGAFGLPGKAVSALLHSPGAIAKELTSPINWLRAVLAGHEAGQNRPPSQPGRENELTGAPAVP